MSTTKDLDLILSRCATDLDRCAGLIKDLPLKPTKENIYRIGSALTEIFDIKEELYKLDPSLKPKDWDAPPCDEEFNEMFGQALIQAEKLKEGGSVKEAIEVFERFISIGPSQRYVAMANAQIRNMRGE